MTWRELSSYRGKRVLLAWEFGGGLGHVSRLLGLADFFRSRGAEVVFAVPPQHRAVLLDHVGPDQLFNSPRVRFSQVAHRGRPHSFAEILWRLGFCNAQALAAAGHEWTRLFGHLGVDLVLLDAAPVAQLASMTAALPAVQITNGFDAPPGHFPTFGLARDEQGIQATNRRRIEALDESIRTATRSMLQQGSAGLAEWLAYPERWYDCVPDADPYGPRLGAKYIGPTGKPPGAVQVDWPPGAPNSPKVFVYLRSASDIISTLKALKKFGARVVCCWPEPHAELHPRLEHGATVVSRKPVSLDHTIPTCDLVVSYGSSTLTSQAILANKPMLLLPQDAEKWVISRAVELRGLGEVVRGRVDVALERLFS